MSEEQAKTFEERLATAQDEAWSASVRWVAETFPEAEEVFDLPEPLDHPKRRRGWEYDLVPGAQIIVEIIQYHLSAVVWTSISVSVAGTTTDLRGWNRYQAHTRQ